jgi:YbbR domain-containing protein
MSDPTLILGDVKPDSLRVSIEGPDHLATRVVKARATLKLDLLTKNSVDVPVPLDAVDANGRVVEGVDVHPTQVRITPKFTLAPEQKMVFVQPTFDDKNLPPGYVVKSYTIDPPSVTATGSSMALARVSSVRTEKIDLSRLTGSQTILVLLHPLGSGIQLNPPSVGVTINIELVGINQLNLTPKSNRPGGSQFPFVPGVPR